MDKNDFPQKKGTDTGFWRNMYLNYLVNYPWNKFSKWLV